jgi:CheY-like chemotaxis protein
MLRVAIFDDVLAARREVFHIPGLDVGVYGDADDVCLICSGERAPDVVCMDYAMGPQHANGADAIRAVRTIGFPGKIVAMSSDPAANAAMVAAGANESLLQKSMLRSYLVALGAGRLPSNNESGGGAGGQGGFVVLPLVALLGALASMTGGALLVGPLGHEPRYHGDLVRVSARVLPADPARLSAIDGVPVAAEAIAIWGAKGKNEKAYEMLAGHSRVGSAEFDVATGGERWRVECTRATRLHLLRGPARRLRAPDEIPDGSGLPAFLDTRYVALSQRLSAGQYLFISGIRAGGVLHASEIADEEHADDLGPWEVGMPIAQGGGLALLGLSAILLGVASRS